MTDNVQLSSWSNNDNIDESHYWFLVAVLYFSMWTTHCSKYSNKTYKFQITLIEQSIIKYVDKIFQTFFCYIGFCPVATHNC